MRQVLLDNFTLQGSYGFLHGRRSRLRESCLQILLEAVVLYDRIHVPADVLERNEASRWTAEQFPGVVIGQSMPKTPDLHHHVVDMSVLNSYRHLLRDDNPFQEFEETGKAYEIELEGHPKNLSPPDWMGRTWGRYNFSERHLYYSWFCMELAGKLRLNYVPNPTRVGLFLDEDFRMKAKFPDFARDILRSMEKVPPEQARSIQEIFTSANVPISLPLVYAFIKGRTKDPRGFVEETLRLRNSRDARSYRTYCENLEKSSQAGDRARLLEAKNEIETLADQWSRSLGKTKGKRTWHITVWFISTDVDTRWPSPTALDRKPQFVLLHRLLSQRGAEASPGGRANSRTE